MKKTKEKKNKILSCIVIILLTIIVISSSMGLYAWARYTALMSSSATAQIAKWYFNLKEGTTKIDNKDETLLAFTRTDNNGHVADGKLAPGTSGVLPIIVDTTNTETDLVYEVVITIENFPQNMILKDLSNNVITPTVSGGNGQNDPRIATIRIKKYVECDSTGEHNETIKWNWPYETGTGSELLSNDEADTNDSGKEVRVGISAVGTEVMSRPLSLSTITDDESNIINTGETITMFIDDSPKQLSYSSKTEGVLYTSSNTNIATVTQNGEITPAGIGNTVITITGKDSSENRTVNVRVKSRINAQVGDTIYYSPNGEFEWDESLVTSDRTEKLSLKSGTGEDYNISTWKVLSVNDDTIEIVPSNSVGSLILKGAQGYNNSVKMLNDACRSLYSRSNVDPAKAITARSINLEDIEKLISPERLSTLRGSEYGQPKYNYSNRYYPALYALEDNNVIDGVTKSKADYPDLLSKSEQNEFIPTTEANIIWANSSIEPIKTRYGFDPTTEDMERIYINILNKNYWIASRCVNPRHYDYCDFSVYEAGPGGFGTDAIFDSRGGIGGSSRGLFPVVSLNVGVLETTENVGVYRVE